MSNIATKRIPDNIIAQARAFPIERIVAAHCGLNLHKQGRNGLVGPCPKCGGTDRFAISIPKRKFLCRGCEAHGDTINLVRFLDNLSFLEAVERLTGASVTTATTTATTTLARPVHSSPVPVQHNDAERIKLAGEIWDQGIDPRGTAAEEYLASRGLDLPLEVCGTVLRFHRACMWESGTVPCMIAAFRNVATDTITGIHRIRLDQPDRWPKAERKMLGTVAGSAIQFDTPRDHLAIGEGIETCLAARQIGFRPIWALGSAGAIERFSPVEGVAELTIIGENDNASRKAAGSCNRQWRPRAVYVYRPPAEFKDVNDLVMRTRNDRT